MEAEGEESNFSFYNSIQSDLIIKRHIIFILKRKQQQTQKTYKSQTGIILKQKEMGLSADPSHQKYERESFSLKRKDTRG